MSIRLYTLFSACLLSACLFAQQVPNGGFESWVSTPQFSLDPEYWNTYNGQLLLSTAQDSMPYEGEWAMRVTPIPNGIGEEGIASVQIPTDFIPPSLDFYAKWDRTATASVGVTVTFYNGETDFYTEYWYPEELTSEWAPISIQLSQIEPIMTHVVIEVGVFIGDFAAGEGWLSVDAMSFDGVTGVDDLSSASIGLFPNPASDMLFVTAADANTSYVIYDAMGKLLDRNSYQAGVDVSELPTGNYFIELKDGDGVLRRSGFVVELRVSELKETKSSAHHP